MNGKIYKITNTITGEAYIGQTIREVDKRFEEHKRGTRQLKQLQSKLQKGIEAYGHNNFTIETLEENIGSQSELTAKETFYIILHKTMQEYNANYGNGPREDRRDFSSISEANASKVHSDCELAQSNEINNELSLHKDTEKYLNSSLNGVELNLFLGIVNEFQFIKEREFDVTLSEIEYMLNSKSHRGSRVNEVINRMPERFTEISDEPLFTFHPSRKVDSIKVIMSEVALTLLSKPRGNSSHAIRIDFGVFRKLESMYSKSLYWLVQKHYKNGSSLIEREELSDILNCPKSYDIRKFHSRVMNPAINELRKNNLQLEVSKLKKGRAITHYEFMYETEE